MYIELAQDISYRIASEHGFWPEGYEAGHPALLPQAFLSEKVALMHSEVSEILEELREGVDPREIRWNEDKPEGVPIELADVVIRCLDMAGALDINLCEAIKTKLVYNENRPHKHGKQF